MLWQRRKCNQDTTHLQDCIGKHTSKNMRKTFNRELLETHLQVQEETFKSISREIYDNIGQVLSLVKLNINTVDVYNPEATLQKLSESKDYLSKTIQHLRDLAKSLNPDFVTEHSLAKAIEQQLHLLQKATGCKTSLTVTGKPYKNRHQHDLVTFRVVQQLLNNIAAYAETTTVSIIMLYDADKLTITIKDNSKGFNIAGENKLYRQLGLAGIRNRVSLINGHVSISCAGGHATTIVLQIPKPAAL